MLQVDPGREFMGGVTKEMEKHKTYIRRGRTEIEIKEKAVSSKPSTKYSRPVGMDEKNLPPLINVRYLYQWGELEGGTKRATDPIWSLKVYQVVENKTKPNEPVVYYLSDGPKRGFVREELLLVPPNT